MAWARRSVILSAFALTACASPDPQAGERTVFTNPYAVPAIDRTGIGPQCEVARGEDATCLGVPLTRNGRGATIGEHRPFRLTRAQRRILRERAELLETLRDQAAAKPAPAPPPPPPRIAGEEGDPPAESDTP